MTDAPSLPTARERSVQAFREAIIVSLAAVAIGLFYNAVTGKGMFADAKPAAAVPQAGPGPEIIPLETALSLHASGTALFVDSRHAFDFRLGHIPGAINVPLKESDAVIAGLSAPKDQPVVVYCDGAECNSSLEVGAKFSAIGFQKVYVFFAGWSAWKESAQSTETGTP